MASLIPYPPKLEIPKPGQGQAVSTPSRTHVHTYAPTPGGGHHLLGIVTVTRWPCRLVSLGAVESMNGHRRSMFSFFEAEHM